MVVSSGIMKLILSLRLEKSKEGSTLRQVCCPYAIDIMSLCYLCAKTPLCWWRSYLAHVHLLCVQIDHFPVMRKNKEDSPCRERSSSRMCVREKYVRSTPLTCF